MVWEEMPTVLPQFGMDKYLAAWGNILYPRFQVNLQFKKKDCNYFLFRVFYLGNWAFIMILWSFFEVYISRARHSNESVLKCWE